SASRPLPRPAQVEQFPAIVRASPCNTGGANYTDARYYLDRAVAQTGLAPTDAFDASGEQTPGIKQCFTATNLAELDAGTHLLGAGTIVQVLALPSRERAGAKQYVFNHPPSTAVVVQIT